MAEKENANVTEKESTKAEKESKNKNVKKGKVTDRLFGLGLPPVTMKIGEMLEPYLSIENLSIHNFANNVIPLKVPRGGLDQLFDPSPTKIPIEIRAYRHLQKPEITSLIEVETSPIVETPYNSLSLTRTPGPKTDGIKGSSANLPFWPGGFDKPKKPAQSLVNEELDEPEEEIYRRLFETDLQWIAPGFTEGIDFSSKGVKAKPTKDPSADTPSDPETWNFWGLKLDHKSKNDMAYQPSVSKVAKQENQVMRLLKELDDTAFNPEEESTSATVPVLKIGGAQTRSSATIMPWAEEIDVTRKMVDFDQQVPSMAFQFPFELDTFQKQAVAKLEDHENVFVAAHTSAGKTVVAEYAVALSERHMTRTVYTSPIKALSNQKFRDFKNNFESVGLVTGDVQINPGASCLIMTTEILRSMLYNGSDVIRDLEFVIFDEIHYLNNEERGHVWEEVLIMLPSHISIIMLSATVPNALQFANWVGEIKKKKIYVISTPKRPVPLEHYLYTGSGGKSKNEIFKILSAEGEFLKRGHDDAIEAKRARQSKHDKQFGPKGGKNNLSEAAEKTTYIGLVSYLKENDKLPVVVFTFSRKRCDQYAQMLCSTDLCTETQKSEIHSFFMKSVGRLRGSDKELPQVRTVHEMLKCGIGVHHSGILPILKEVVEMLFQRGLVKLLFATETFAMGVNMPARTVVFDSIRKHDGICFRNLNPAEYIQMAGRAGRRGLDTTGTVILLCKTYVPEITDLKQMMQGKAAKLESQFRLTYSMILNLLRVESLSVEEVMKRSFLEAGTRKLNIDDTRSRLNAVRAKLGDLEWGKEKERDVKLLRFYREAKEVLSLEDSMIPFLQKHTKQQILVPGRVVIVQKLPAYCSRFGIILDTFPPRSAEPTKFTVIILTSGLDKISLKERGLQVSDCEYAHLLEGYKTPADLDRLFLRFAYLSHNSLVEFNLPPFDPANPAYCDYVVVEVEYGEILDITNESTQRVDVKAILGETRRRQGPERQLPPNLGKAVECLISAHNRVEHISILHANQRLTASKDMNLVNEVLRYYESKTHLKVANIWNEFQNSPTHFFDEFREVFCYLRLRDTEEHLDFLLSPRSLRLHEEYESRINVLKELKYIDDEHLVQLKGRVACEMGNQNELMVTEMVLNNVLADAPPEEVAALLSCMVFEVKSTEEPTFDRARGLKERVKTVKEIARNIGEIQRKYGMKEPVDQFVEQFKFGLAEVVYEWACGKEFYEIMKLTDVQEGLIVRTIQRLDEMIRDVKDAARIIGDPSLKRKMEEASECIKRDIVFAASLYTQ